MKFGTWFLAQQQNQRGVLACIAKSLIVNRTNRLLKLIQNSTNCFAVSTCGLLETFVNFFGNNNNILLANLKSPNPPSFLKRPSRHNPTTVGVAGKLYLNSKMEGTDDQLIWVDCEMSGLDVNKETIMEIACIITGPNLEIIDRQSSIIIKTDEAILNNMDGWCILHHGQSGLTQSCLESKITMEQAENMLIKFVTTHTKPGACPLAGNSIYLDRVFISKYMPKFHEHFHYRNVDVSTIKEVVRRWFPHDYEVARDQKRYEHRTMADIEDSIAELKYYREAVFKQPQQTEEQVHKVT